MKLLLLAILLLTSCHRIKAEIHQAEAEALAEDIINEMTTGHK